MYSIGTPLLYPTPFAYLRPPSLPVGVGPCKKKLLRVFSGSGTEPDGQASLAKHGDGRFGAYGAGLEAGTLPPRSLAPRPGSGIDISGNWTACRRPEPAIERLIVPENDSVRIHTLKRAAAAFDAPGEPRCHAVAAALHQTFGGDKLYRERGGEF